VRRLLTLWSGWLVLMAGANLATPLYAGYAQRFGFSPVVLTAIFATYAIVLVPALVLFGRLSDRFGRRPVVAGGLAAACVGLALFAAAEGTAWLDSVFSLAASVEAVGAVLIAVVLGIAAWHAATSRAGAPRRRAAAPRSAAARR
jgi:MFS family permease